MKPKMEKTTKPAKKLVPLLMSARMMASLGAEGPRGPVRLPVAHGPAGGRAGGQRHLLVAVVVEAVVAAQRREGPQADGVGKENLGPSIYPHLGMGQAREDVKGPAGLARPLIPSAPHLPLT